MPRPIEVEREVLARALEETNWNKSAAARRLKICREALRKQIDKHGLVQPDPEPTPEPEELTVKEEHRLKVENRLLKRRLQDLLDASVREDDMRNLFLSCAELDLNPPAWLEPPKRGGPERTIATALLSDCHFDEVVNPAEFNWRNGYNRAIAEQRLRNFFDGVLSLSGEVINGVKMEQMVLAMAGDMLSGNIHEELRQTNEVPILDSVLHWSEQLAAGIERLLGTFSEVYVPCVVGNHGRIDKKPRHKLRVKENYDWLLYHVVAKHFRGIEEVVFAIPESTDHSWPVYRTNYLMTHGDQFRGGSGIAGILTPVFIGDQRKTRRQVALDLPYDHMLIGHFHQLRDFGPVLLNGSLKGYDEFAFIRNFFFELPRQMYWLTDAEHGKTVKADIHVIDEGEYWRVNERRRA